ncbi:MAG: hypothetical protein GC154_17465 [bacterium]|nr:hypothetical protein [bacterium]
MNQRTDIPMGLSPRDKVADAFSDMVATRLKQVTISDPDEANRVFGRKGDDGTTPIVITPKRTSKTNAFSLTLGMLMAFVGLFLNQVPFINEYIAKPIIFSGIGYVTYWPLMVLFLLIGVYPLIALSIPSGVFALMTKHGRYIGVYEAGRHFLPPWYKIAYMVTRQSTAYNAPVKNCPTSDNVMVKVDLLLTFHVEEPEAFVYKLGAEKFDDLLASSAEEAIRGLVRGVSHDRAYELRGKGAGEMISGLNEQFQIFGVVFTSATITNVVLPDELAKALENQTVYEAKKREQEKHQEFELKVLNDRESLSREELNKKNERLAADEEARRDRQKIMKETEEIEADKKKRLAEIEAEKDAAVMARLSEGELKASQNRAEALRVKSEAESFAAERMKSLRAYEIETRRLDMLNALASNGRLVISGNNGDNIIAQITAAARASDLMSTVALAESQADVAGSEQGETRK